MSLIKHNVTAIITDKRGRILSIGKNSYVKTHPIQAKYASKVGKEHSIYLHAEIAAIIKCENIDRAHKITVMRLNRVGEPRFSKPCSICMEAIRTVGIKHIEHT